MDLKMAIHKALDFFFCDRCPFECSFYADGTDCKIWYILGEYVCPFSKLWEVLPEERLDYKHPIRWPRSWLGKVLQDEGKQNKEDYNERVRRVR